MISVPTLPGNPRIVFVHHNMETLSDTLKQGHRSRFPSWTPAPRLELLEWRGLEIVGVALASANAIVQLLSAIKRRYVAHKEIPNLIDSAQRRIRRIQKTVAIYRTLEERSSLPRAVFVRVVKDFNSIKADLDHMQAKISSGSKFKNWLSSPSFVDSLSSALPFLGPLEMHLDLYGLMSYRDNTVTSYFADLSSSIQRLRLEAALELKPILNELKFKVDAIYECLGLGTHETMNIGRTGTSKDTSVDNLDQVETQSLEEFSSLSSQARELLEMLASSGLSAEDKRGLSDKIHRIWSGWRVPIEDVEFGTAETNMGGFRKPLGEGRFSSVYKGCLTRRCSSGEKEEEPLLIALKRLKIERHELPGRRADFLRELFLQLDIDHPCVLKTYGGFWPEVNDDVAGSTGDEDDNYTHPYIVMERMTCNVAKAVRKNRLQDAGTQKRLIVDVAEGLAHLHGRRIVHRDIKPENVLLRLQKNGEMIGNAKICDFGISRRMRDAQQETMYSQTGGPSGTIGYMPPELLCNLRKCPSRKSWDVWSFGVLICYIVVMECRTE